MSVTNVIDYSALAKEMSTEKLALAFGSALAGIMQNGSKEDQRDPWGALLQNPGNYVMGQKAISGVPNAVYPHGPGGLFSTLGLDNVVINAHMSPEGLDSVLPVYGTRYMNPIYGFLTGFSEDGGSEPDGPCDDCLGGTLQGCQQTAQFGHVCRGSDEIHIPRITDLVNRGETTALTLLGDVMGPSGIVRTPTTTRGWINMVTRAEMVKVGILLQRWAYQVLWSGNPANNMNGGYAEPPGLEMQVREGIVDIHTQELCSALDSYVVDFGCTDVEGAVGGFDLVSWISNMVWWIGRNARRMKLNPTKHVFVGRPDLFEALTAIWPCRYLTDRCQNSQGTAVGVINDATNTTMRDAMRNGSYLLVRGKKIPFIQDDGMTEENADAGSDYYNDCLAAGEFMSDLFYLPLMAKGMKTLYWEHKDYAPLNRAIADVHATDSMWTDGGRLFWTNQKLRGCVKLSAEMDIRPILRTPHIAGRIDSIVYSTVRHSRSPFYNDPYFLKGGTSSQADISDAWYTPWNTPS